ncbi:helix-turn-helix domain-containing protein [Paenibacillus chitinolyticus]|uniref:helix-turn-helix domain-containing protein n=1 Tax=Paenibacillus chitinolyticus TaxID=79263 RepID=UPI00366DAC3E
MLSFRIKKARNEKGLNQSQLAELLGKTRTAIVNWETGYALPKEETIDEIARILSVTKEWLLDKSNDEFEEMELKSAEILNDINQGFATAIGARLRYYRKRKGLTLDEVAEKLNCSRGAVQGYEARGREPNFDTLNRLADLYDMSIDHLLGRNQKKEENPFEVFNAEPWVMQMLTSEKSKINAMEQVWKAINAIGDN